MFSLGLFYPFGDPQTIFQCFHKICQKRLVMQLTNGMSEQEIEEGYQRVRKVIFTPTRVIYTPPEMIMGNRVLRNFDRDGTHVLRVTFRDDNNRKMRANATGELLDICVKKYLEHGIVVANRDFGFLGCSSSQMRDNGAYFMVKNTDNRHKNACKMNSKFKPNIDSVRNQLGNFLQIENIPKLMARLGQCFTQSRVSVGSFNS